MAEAAPQPSPLLARLREGADDPSDAGEMREAILAAALSQVEDFGVRRFTMDEVGRRAGVSRVTVYRHFSSKDGLLEAVLMREVLGVMGAIEAAVRPYEGLQDRIVEGFVFALTSLRENELLMRLLRTEPELMLPALTVRAEPLLTVASEFLARLAVPEGAEVEALPPERVREVSELLARIALSFLLTPESALGLRDRAGMRRFAELYLAPIVAGHDTAAVAD